MPRTIASHKQIGIILLTYTERKYFPYIERKDLPTLYKTHYHALEREKY